MRVFYGVFFQLKWAQILLPFPLQVDQWLLCCLSWICDLQGPIQLKGHPRVGYSAGCMNKGTFQSIYTRKIGYFKVMFLWHRYG